MFNPTLQSAMKSGMLANIEIHPLLTATQRLAEVELAKEVPDFKELISQTATLTAQIMRNSIFMEQALVNSGSSEEELLMVTNVMLGTVDRKEYIDEELIELIESNERFGKELSQPMIDTYGDRAPTILMEKLQEFNMFGEFNDAIIKAIESLKPSQEELESLSRVWTKDNVKAALPHLSETFNSGWDLAESGDHTKH